MVEADEVRVADLYASPGVRYDARLNTAIYEHRLIDVVKPAGIAADLHPVGGRQIQRLDVHMLVHAVCRPDADACVVRVRVENHAVDARPVHENALPRGVVLVRCVHQVVANVLAVQHEFFEDHTGDRAKHAKHAATAAACPLDVRCAGQGCRL